MFCPNCGSQLPDGSAFCGSCGHRLASRVKFSSGQPSMPPTQPMVEPAAPEPQFDLFTESAAPQPTPAQEPIFSPQPVAAQRSDAPKAPVYTASVQHWPVSPTKEAPQKAAKKERKPRPRQSGVTRFFSVILCILMVLSLFLISVIGLVRSLFTEDSLRTVLNEVKFSDLKFTAADGTEQTLADAINQSIVSYTPDYVRDGAEIINGIIDYTGIEDALDYEIDTSLSVDGEDIDAIFATDEVRKYIVDIILGYSNCILYGEEIKTISAEDIASFVVEHESLIRTVTHKDLLFFDEPIMIDEMNDYFDFTTISSPESIEDMIGLYLSPITFVFSTLYYILIAVAFICLILIVVLNLKNLPACATKLAVTAIIFGVCMILAEVGLTIASGAISDLAFAAAISAILSHISSYFLIWGIVALVLGLVLILVRKYVLKPRFE